MEQVVVFLSGVRQENKDYNIKHHLLIAILEQNSYVVSKRLIRNNIAYQNLRLESDEEERRLNEVCNKDNNDLQC